MTELNPGRQAELDLAIWAAIDARDSGDENTFLRSVEELVALNYRLRTEQRAELGERPWTIEGSVAVLHVAARIVRDINGGNHAAA